MKHSGTEDTYILVTTISTHRMRYCIPVSTLSSNSIELAKRAVLAERVQEFSQSYLGEQIVDAKTLNTDQMIELFDADNDYLRGWTIQQKIEYANR